MDAIAEVIDQHLDLNVAGAGQIALEVDAIIAERLAHLILRHCKDALKLVFVLDQTNTAPAATGHRLEHQWEANLPGGLLGLGKGMHDRCARQHRQPGGSHSLASGYFITHKRHHFSGRADKRDIDIVTDFSKAGIFREKAIARMDRLCISNKSGTDNIRDVEITFPARSWPDTNTLICQTDRERVTVGFGMGDHAAYPHLAASPNNAERDFAPISNQNFTKHKS